MPRHSRRLAFCGACTAHLYQEITPSGVEAYQLQTEREIASNVSLHGRNIPTLKHRWQRIREPLRESAGLKLGCDLGHSLLLRHDGHEGRPGGPPVAILLHEHPEDAGIGRNGLATRVFGLENCVIGREREVPINCH
jgi:hypothetical protein